MSCYVLVLCCAVMHLHWPKRHANSKFTSRVPISAADVALMLSTLGVDRVITVDLHSGQTQVCAMLCCVVLCSCAVRCVIVMLP
jgi:phosphoribosylpyrophosphate synthetase